MDGAKTGFIVQFIERYCIVPKGNGAGQPMKLADFQKDAIEALSAPGTRTGEFSLGPGNGKSSLMAAWGLAHLCLDEWSPQVPLIGTTLKQIEAATYSVAVRMSTMSPEIESRTMRFHALGNKTLHCGWNSGVMFPTSADPDGTPGLRPESRARG